MKKTVLICILILLISFVLFSKSSSESFANDENPIKEIIWENKLLKLDDVMDKLKSSLNECGVNNINLEKSDFDVIDSRKRLIELLPVTKLLDKVTYDQIQCFVSKFDPENYLVIGKTISNVPKILRPKNIVIVNNMLYQSTPYGVIKYKIPLLGNFAGLDSLNASIECGIINDFNTFNMSTDPIFHLDGKIIQKRGDKFVDIKNNDNYEITDINNKIELLNKKIINKIENEKLENKQVQTQIVQANTVNSTKVLENMVDVGGVIQLDITDPAQLKVIDTKTFLPVVTTAIKAEQEIKPEVVVAGAVIIGGKVVSEEVVRQEIKQELVAQGIPTSEQEAIIEEKVAAIKEKSDEAVRQEIKQELVAQGVPTSEQEAIIEEKVAAIKEEAVRQEIKQELVAQGVPTSQQEAIIEEKVAAIKEEAIKQEIKQELIAQGVPTSQQEAIIEEKVAAIKEEAIKQEIKQELIAQGVPVSEQDAIAAKKLATLRALEEAKIKSTLPIIQKTDVDIGKLLNTLVSIFEYDGIIYMAEPNIIRPFSNWALKVNSILAKNKLEIKGVIPHFYHLNNVFNYRLCIILSDDFYIWVNKENVSGVLDLKKDWGITFSPNVPDVLPCDELKTILEQMEKANVITKAKSALIIKNYRC